MAVAEESGFGTDIEPIRSSRLILLFGAITAAQRGPAEAARIWVVDVEGGQGGTLRTPTGQTGVIDTGFPGARDLDRIMAAIADAGSNRSTT